MFYAPSMLSAGSQQDQQSIAGSASVSKSIRSTIAAAAQNNLSANELFTKYLAVYPEMVEVVVPPADGNGGGGTNSSAAADTSRSTPNSTAAAAAGAATSSTGTTTVSTGRTGHLSRKCSEVFSRRHRRRLERQSSLDAGAAEPTFSAKLMRNQSDTIATTTTTTTTSAAAAPSFLHTKAVRPGANPRQHFMANNAQAGAAAAAAAAGSDTASTSSAVMVVAQPNTTRSSRLQRHRSSETHDERLKHQSRAGLFQSMQQQHSHLQHHHLQQQQLQQQHAQHQNASSIGSGVNDVEDMELGLGLGRGAANDACNRALQSWILGESFSQELLLLTYIGE